ncbi:MAG: hypothetical protein AB7U81_04010 [Thiohalomonadaceae bacterium]
MSKLTSIKPFAFALCFASALACGQVMADETTDEGKKPEQEQEKNDVQKRTIRSDVLLLSEADTQQGDQSGTEGQDKDKNENAS